jgi:DNA-binding NtrC family response regulator
MRDDELMHRTLGMLTASKWFEEAAEVTLRAMLSAAGEVAGALGHHGRGTLLRGIVHLRPGEGYRRLWVVEHDAGSGSVSGRGQAAAPRASAGPDLEAAYLPSATAWRFLVEHGSAVLIDVQLGTLCPLLAAGPGTVGDAGHAVTFEGHKTREQLRRRDATHVHIIPLRLPGGAVAGMVSIEAGCMPAFAEALFPACNERLQILTDVAAPYLADLPSQPVATPKHDDLLPVVGRSTANLVEVLRVFAQQEETILISGPTGAGKSRLAHWCHDKSRRKNHPFVTLELRIAEDMQMAELFGWRRGAFTGADTDNPGAIGRAEGGTLFIDEIDKLSSKAQAGLLRVLEERAYRRLGETAGDRRANVRFVVGTNVNLHEVVRAGRFREDLYFRINVLPLRVPSLAERRDEIPHWASYMLAQRHRAGGGEGEALLDSEAIALLCECPWPGNLRQLENIVRRAYVIALVEHTEGGGAFVLRRPHVERSLAHEVQPGVLPLLEQLQQAARAFVREAERRRGSGGHALPLDVTDAFRGLVLEAAVERLGSREEAFYLFGKGNLVKSRNHHKVLRGELDKVAELCSALGKDAAGPRGEGPDSGEPSD